MRRVLGWMLAAGMVALSGAYLAVNLDKPIWALKFWIGFARAGVPPTVVVGQGPHRVEAYLAPTGCPGPQGREMHFVAAPGLASDLAGASSAQVEIDGRPAVVDVVWEAGVPSLSFGNATLYLLEQDGLAERMGLVARWRDGAGAERGGQ